MIHTSSPKATALLIVLLVVTTWYSGECFQPFGTTTTSTTRSQSLQRRQEQQHFISAVYASPQDNVESDIDTAALSRRSLLVNVPAFVGLTLLGMSSSSSLVLPQTAHAAEREPLERLLYRIVRVREATQQETRLIKNGKFKDVQRANVKLAVRFMVENYRLNDAFVGASSYLEGNARRVEAGQVGLNAVQNLQTILEYFDSADVENIKVSSSGLGGKEDLVLKGLDAAKRNIDDFLAYFPKSQVDEIKATVEEENKLNVQEFDKSLGELVNMPTTT